MSGFGPSGCGKSTTLAAIAGLVRPDHGRVALGDDVWFDSARGLVEVCFEQVPDQQANCGYRVVLLARDLAPPPSASAKSVTGSPLGLSYASLLAKLHADDHLARKNIVRGADGTVVFVSAEDEDPPPARYDHGPQSYLFQEYFLRDGIVVAYAYKATEN